MTDGDYRDYGPVDDRIAGEGDSSFKRMNSRLRGNQLNPGEVQLSQNGRMDKDGTWQPRKGLTTLNGSITVISKPLPTLPVDLDFELGTISEEEVFGSCVFSDPTLQLPDDFIFTATNGLCVIVRARDKVKFKAKYPGSEVVTERCEMLQAFNKVFIFRGGYTTLQMSPTLTTLALTSANRSANNITVGALNHGLSIGDFVTITGLTGQLSTDPDPNDVHTITAVTTNSFTFNQDHSASATTFSYNSTAGSCGTWTEFEAVDTGEYTLPNHITDTVTTTNGIAQINEPSHGLIKGQELSFIKGTGDFADADLDKVRVTKIIDVNNFEVTLNIDTNAGGVIVLAQKKPVSYLVHMPATPFGVVNQRRLWLPYFYEEDNSLSSLQWVERGNKDEIIASDILDETTYDVIGQRLRITGGSNDFVVGIEPFTEDTLMVFARRSVHKVSGVSGSLSDVSVNVITPDLGCNARRSIVQVGSKVLFLSDRGVYALTFHDQYNLRGTEMPISESIQPIIDRINALYVHNAVGVYFNNRYYLALPLDQNVENSHLIVYNFINGGFESIDFVDSEAFKIRDLLVAREGRENNLYITTQEGGIHKVEGAEGADEVSVQKGSETVETIPVDSVLKTREYDLETIDRIYFTRAEIHMKSSDQSESDADISFEMVDPDSTLEGIKLSNLLETPTLDVDEDASLRVSIRHKGFSASVKVKPTLGRPFVRAIKLDGRITSRSTTSKQ